jgi:hypothetical protein
MKHLGHTLEGAIPDRDLMCYSPAYAKPDMNTSGPLSKTNFDSDRALCIITV